ncbi:hypothetical protein [Leptospira idonii]|uniref:Uncharacterized protein n=1 Tax=Leptospira idonii TaxID=1193500 RepID=A0A4R9M030_9LEPT|nr:hypothetical protein [Leptospira idonii]TGN19271.1 hypothetical protein EHS15_10180 [Leptospira idonii]
MLHVTLGGNIGVSNTGGAGKGVTTAGQLTYSKQKGVGVNVSASYKDPSKASTSNTPNADKPLSSQRPNQMSGTGVSIGYSEKGGYEASVDILGANAYNWDSINGLTANTNWAVDKYRSDEREKIKKEREKQAKLLQEGKDAFAEDWKDKHPEDANLTPEEIFDKNAEQKRAAGAEKDGSRENLLDYAKGFIQDNFLNYGGSDSSGYVDEKGQFHANTCFVAGTKITKLKREYYEVADRLEPNSKYEEQVSIEEIQLKDIVRSWNEETGQFEYKEVYKYSIRQSHSSNFY